MIANFGLVRSIGSAGMLWLAVSPIAAAQTASNFQIDAGHTGAIEMPGFEGPIAPIWSVDLDGPISYPLIANGMVYVNAAYHNNSAVRLVALSAKTGKIVWQKSSKQDEYYGAAAYDNGLIFEVTSSGYLSAYDATTGKKIWEHKFVDQFCFQNPPVAGGGYVALTGDGSGGTVYTLEEKSGKVLWKYNISESTIPALSTTQVFVNTACDIYAFSIETGNAIWADHENCEGGFNASTALYQGHVFDMAQQDGGGLMIDAATGSVQGSFNSPIPAFLNGVAFQAIGSMIVASRIASGNAVWHFTLPDAALSAPPVTINNTLYGLTSRGFLYGLDAETGKLQQTLKPGVGTNSGGETLTAGLGAGQGLLVVPSGSHVTAYQPVSNGSSLERSAVRSEGSGQQL